MRQDGRAETAERPEPPDGMVEAVKFRIAVRMWHVRGTSGWRNTVVGRCGQNIPAKSAETKFLPRSRIDCEKCRQVLAEMDASLGIEPGTAERKPEREPRAQETARRRPGRAKAGPERQEPGGGAADGKLF